MKDLDADKIFQLQVKVEGLIELELGQRVPFVCLLATKGHLGIFTNRRDDQEVVGMLEVALENIRKTEGRWMIEEESNG